MAVTKTETLNLRVDPNIKSALRTIATREHRTLANTVEYLIVEYCRNTGISLDTSQLNIPLDIPSTK